MPLSFAPAEAYQLDGSDAVVVMAGAAMTEKAAHVRRSHGLPPHRMTMFKLSDDAKFAGKSGDVVGFYVDPPPCRRAVDRREEPDPGARPRIGSAAPA